MSKPAVTITPLSTERQQQVIKETQAYINQAASLFNIKHADIDITFNLKGRAAGMYRVKRKIFSDDREIRYNSFIFSKYYVDNFNTTIPHEVAHYISDLIYDLRNIKPHGKEWKEIMQAFNADAAVTADYDLSGIPQRNRTLHTYHCACREHQIGVIRHNRIKNQHGRYTCNFCKQAIYARQSAIDITA